MINTITTTSNHNNILSDTTLTDEIRMTLQTVSTRNEQQKKGSDYSGVNYYEILKRRAISVFNINSEIEKQLRQDKKYLDVQFRYVDSGDDLMTVASNEQLVQAITQFYEDLKVKNKLKNQNVFKAQVFLTEIVGNYSETEQQFEVSFFVEQDNSYNKERQQEVKNQETDVNEDDLNMFQSCNDQQNETPGANTNNFQEIFQYDEQLKKLEEKRKIFMESFYDKKQSKKSLDTLQFRISPICLQSILIQLLKRNENKEIAFNRLVEMGLLPESEQNDDVYQISDYGTRLKQIQNLILRSANQHQTMIKEEQKQENDSAVLNMKKALETTDQQRKILNFSKKDFQITQQNFHQHDDFLNSQIMMKSSDEPFHITTDPINPAEDVKNSQFYTLIHKKDNNNNNTTHTPNKQIQQPIKDSNALQYLINAEQISYYPSLKTQQIKNPLTAKQSQQILRDSLFRELGKDMIVVKKQDEKVEEVKGKSQMSNLHIEELKQFLTQHQNETMTLMKHLDAKFVGEIIQKAFVIKSSEQQKKMQQNQENLKKFQTRAQDDAMLSVPLKLFMEIITKSD